jgi:phenylacetate-CoA ligase
MSSFYDTLETRSPAEREAAQFAALPRQIANAKKAAAAFARILKGVDSRDVTSREALAKIPVLRKSELLERQKSDPPFGGLAAIPAAEAGRIFASPGPIYEPEGTGDDYWRIARALFAAGVRAGELIHNTFAYHFTPAGAMLESGARALGCPVVPAGVGQTELQVQAIAHLRPAAYVGTPSFLNIILDKAKEMKAYVSSLSKGLVSGEALPPSLRVQLKDRGLDVLQCYASADLGLIAYESEAKEGLIIDEGVIVEILRPGTGNPVPEGEVGEVVVTTFTPEYPLIRFATGDLSAVLSGISPCGRTNMRIKGWMGRADQTTKVKGMFVHPSQIAAVVDRHGEVTRARLVVESVDNQDVMTLHCEASLRDARLVEAISSTIREVCKLRGEVKLVEPGSLPNDGKVIDDTRTYE